MFLNAYPRRLCKKNADAGQMDKGEETRGELIITRSNSAELLKFEEECFHKMAFLVEQPIDKPRIGFVLLGRDAEIRIMVGNKLAKRPLAVSLICENGRAFQTNLAEQFFSNSDIVGVAGGQHDLDRVAQGIHNGVNLRASAASTDANALIGLGFVFANLPVLGGGFYGFCGF